MTQAIDYSSRTERALFWLEFDAPSWVRIVLMPALALFYLTLLGLFLLRGWITGRWD